jgi:glycosyltransferase involved in cell wall biosynthesis
MAEAPLFSIVTPVYNPPIDALQDTINSVLKQSFRDWEWILVDDKSTDPNVLTTLRAAAAADPRIRVIERETNGHIAAASNDGVEAARGQFIALLDHDDLLVRTALERNARVIEEFDDVDYIYSDEDKIDAKGKHYDVFEKPPWSPERLRAQNYCCHFSVLRTSLVREVGAFRPGYDGSQDHDLILRVTERARRVEHIQKVLYHWRVVPGSEAGVAGAKPYAADAGRRAVQDHLDRMGIKAEAVPGPFPGVIQLHRQLPAERTVSIIIPTIGSTGLVWGRERVLVVEAVRSALAHTKHENLEIVVVYDAPTPLEVLSELREIAGDKLVLVPFMEKFNYARKMNFGVLASRGKRLILLNDDVEVRTDNWVEELLAPLEEPDVGMTGAMLLFSSNTIQHVGHSYYRGHYAHPGARSAYTDTGIWGTHHLNREVSGVTAACAGMRREVFLEVGGFSEQFPANFNDVDLCYKVRVMDYRIVTLGVVELFHFESMTREKGFKKWEMKQMRDRWGFPIRDPYTPVFPGMAPTRAERLAEKALAKKRKKSALD